MSRARSIAHPQQLLPLPKVALEAHALRDPEARDDIPLDLFPGLPGGFARPPKLPSRLIEMRDKSIVLDGCGVKEGGQLFNSAVKSHGK